jgi:hypothetical protein
MEISLTHDAVTPDLKRLLAEVSRPRVLIEAGAKTVQVEIVKHLRKLQARGNQMGWPSQGFFAGGRESVERNVGIAKISDDGALITIADLRFVHRLKGGPVSPKRAKRLAIPLRPEAYALAGQGTLRQSAPQLRLRRGQLGLMKGGQWEAWFQLVKRVSHKPHPADAPDPAALAKAAHAAMKKVADRLLAAKTKG